MSISLERANVSKASEETQLASRIKAFRSHALVVLRILTVLQKRAPGEPTFPSSFGAFSEIGTLRLEEKHTRDGILSKSSILPLV
jgi:hypothetical protein